MPDLNEVERQVDAAFESNGLLERPYAQAIWTVLSVAEDMHLKNLVDHQDEPHVAATFVDGLMNSLTHPIRACYANRGGEAGTYTIDKRLIDGDYQNAVDWLDAAEDYSQFCTIFPLYHAGELHLRAEGTHLLVSDWKADDLVYESYDRLVPKQEGGGELVDVHQEAFAGVLRANITRSGSMFSVRFTKELVQALLTNIGPVFEKRHHLPSDWAFSNFTLREYRNVVVCLQCLAHGWFYARQIVAFSGAPAVAYPGSVWTPRRGELVKLIAANARVEKRVVDHVLTYLTFGAVGVRSPDVAIQPLIDLKNGQVAVSPFVFMHMNAERNLCVLLNQVPADRKLYSQLVHQKENEARKQVEEEISNRGLRLVHGEVDGTDVDLAVIDDSAKICLCIEIKWFIEPAEVREILDRSKELAKGVRQAKRIAASFASSNRRLRDLLKITNEYRFFTAVGSSNFIGAHRVQDPLVPIIKLWHLASFIRDHGLQEAVSWLHERRYLPKEGVDYKILPRQVASGEWHTTWYGIQHLGPAAGKANLMPTA